METQKSILPSFSENPFSGTAEYYAQYRIPYPAALLEDLVLQAKISGQGCLLDLGSGPGRVALPMARFFKEVVAVDSELEMIDRGRQECERSGVRNICWKVGWAEDLDAPAASFELITIGEAFHRMDRPRVADLAIKLLGPGNALAILGCNSVWKGRESWQQRAVKIIDRWTKPKRKDPGSLIPQPPSDRQVLKDAGFVNSINRRFPTPHTWTLDSFLGYLYSTSAASRQVLGENIDFFEADLRRELLACDPSGNYPETIDFYYDLAFRPE